MKEKGFKKLANELMELIGDSTPATRVKPVVRSSYIELHPDGIENCGSAFYHMSEVVDFCRVKRCSCYTTIDFESKYVICVIH